MSGRPGPRVLRNALRCQACGAAWIIDVVPGKSLHLMYPCSGCDARSLLVSLSDGVIFSQMLLPVTEQLEQQQLDAVMAFTGTPLEGLPLRTQAAIHSALLRFTALWCRLRPAAPAAAHVRMAIPPSADAEMSALSSLDELMTARAAFIHDVPVLHRLPPRAQQWIRQQLWERVGFPLYLRKVRSLR